MRMAGLPPTFAPPDPQIFRQAPKVTQQRVEEIVKDPVSAATLAEMYEAPCNYRMRIVDNSDPTIGVDFILTQRAGNANRIMRDKGVPCFSIGEFAGLLRASRSARLAGHDGLSVAGLLRFAELRYLGREIGLVPMEIEFVPCKSSSTSSGAAPSGQPDAPSSTGTTSSSPAEAASATPA